MSTTQLVLLGKEEFDADTLYMSFELGDKKWQLTLSDGRRGPSRYRVDAGDTDAVLHCIGKARERGKLELHCRVHSRYEAGREAGGCAAGWSRRASTTLWSTPPVLK